MGADSQSNTPFTFVCVCAFFAPSLSGRRRCTGWFSAWLVAVRLTEVRMSNESFPSGAGYSIGLHSLMAGRCQQTRERSHRPKRKRESAHLAFLVASKSSILL